MNEEGREPKNQKEYRLAVEIFIKLVNETPELAHLQELKKEANVVLNTQGAEIAYYFIKHNTGKTFYFK